MVAKDFNKYLDNTVNFSNGTKIHQKNPNHERTVGKLGQARSSLFFKDKKAYSYFIVQENGTPFWLRAWNEEAISENLRM